MGKTRLMKKVKNELVFDNKAREDFLKGFSKRKLQRKKAAKEENDRKLKVEVKRIRDEVRNASGLCSYFQGNNNFLIFRPKTWKTSSNNHSNQSKNWKMF